MGRSECLSLAFILFFPHVFLRSSPIDVLYMYLSNFLFNYLIAFIILLARDEFFCQRIASAFYPSYLVFFLYVPDL